MMKNIITLIEPVFLDVDIENEFDDNRPKVINQIIPKNVINAVNNLIENTEYLNAEVESLKSVINKMKEDFDYLNNANGIKTLTEMSYAKENSQEKDGEETA